jgi:hypothetical protein
MKSIKLRIIQLLSVALICGLTGNKPLLLTRESPAKEVAVVNDPALRKLTACKRYFLKHNANGFMCVRSGCMVEYQWMGICTNTKNVPRRK